MSSPLPTGARMTCTRTRLTQPLTLIALALAVGIALLTLLPSPLTRAAAPAPDPAQEAAGGVPIKALLVIGGCCHDYAKQKDILTKGISARANVEWTVAYDPDAGT